ncbi:MAG TPA: class II fructose-1,6-bisphosphate aldolase [Spirochaetota bacterium]|nr:class II fructose-1,6-bisphosphate aldolase [Spirochaetota bacterium]HOM39039.1 class II fructose-1,6-bisphosphate aldolase [Spirochaetota bacterium]HPQ49908.1 class II fructose-1,6-bisphosphate aldolase [Spirochaetota bacterium]
MPLVTSKEMFKKAYEGGYAIGAFNINNMEIVQAIVEAAYEEKSPVILQASAGARKYAGPIYIKKLAEAAVAMYPELPIVIHLDHGETFEICKECIDDGFTSVMIDGSKLPFEENIKLTKKVVDYAHSKGVVVEAELGKLAGVEDNIKVSEREATFTDPEQAVEFVERTGIDSLAIAIGTSHGAYKFKGEPRLDFERLKTIAEKLKGFPLVLHGASSVPQYIVERANNYGGKIDNARGVPEDMLRKSAQMGICKINIDTDLRLAMTATIREQLAKDPKEFDPRKYLGPARDAVKEIVKHKIRNVLGYQIKYKI